MFFFCRPFSKMLLLFIGISAGISCKKFIDIPEAGTQLTTSIVFSDDKTATAAMVGVYSRMMQSPKRIMNGGMSLYPGLSADDLARTLPGGDDGPFEDNALSGKTLACSNLYTSAFLYIIGANTVLDGLAGNTRIPPDVNKQLTGEAKFVRAIVYFYLVNLFGDVPLETSANYEVNAIKPRSAVTEVYRLIVSDLHDAQSLFEASYSSGNAPDRTRPGLMAATALLARVQLYLGHWADAEEQAAAVIADKAYRLEPQLDNVFLASSMESIWQLRPVVNSINTSEGNTFIPPDGSMLAPSYKMTVSLLSAFEYGDGRLLHWTQSKTIGDSVYTYPSKYKTRTGGPPFSEYNIVLRLSEQYLISAEARAMQNKLAPAMQDLAMVRSRAGLPLPAAADRLSLLAAIAHENQVEFFAEWGHRWLDLKRTGQADSVLHPEKPGWEPSAALYPIPFSELQKNARLKQNPGY